MCADGSLLYILFTTHFLTPYTFMPQSFFFTAVQYSITESMNH